ncbi:MAG TPA: cache domain-containing protein [bacterium]|nr:cache domain-containing protein [bacterium]
MSIRAKLTIFILSAVFVVFMLLTWASFSSDRKNLEAEIKKGAMTLLEKHILTIDSELESVEKEAKGLALAIQSFGVGTDEQLENLIKYFLDDSPIVYGSTISFEPQQGSLRAPYYYRSGGDILYRDLSRPAYDYPKWEWFATPRLTGKPLWSEPYLDVGGGNAAMTTYSFPFDIGGKFAGVTTADVALSDLTDTVDLLRVGRHGYAFLLSKKGTFLSMRRKEWKLKLSIFDAASEFGNEELRALGKKMLAGETGFISLFDSMNNKQSWFTFGPISKTGWSLAIVFPEDDLLEPLYRQKLRIFFISIAGMVAIFIVVYLISSRISEPISELAVDVRRFAASRLGSRVKNVSTGDEIVLLKGSFEDMKESLSNMLDDLSAEKKELENVLDGMLDGVILLSPAWKVIRLNAVAKKSLGMSVGDHFIEFVENEFESSINPSELQNQCNERAHFSLIRKGTTAEEEKLECSLMANYDERNAIRERMVVVRVL